MTDAQGTDRSIADPRIGQLPERLRLAIDGASIRAFAEKAGIAEGTLRNLISGGVPRLDNVLRIADAAGVSAAWLATGEGRMRAGEEGSQTPWQHRPSAGNEAAGWSDVRKLSIPARLRRAGEILSLLEEEMGYSSPPMWREMIRGLIFSHGLDEAGAALLLERLQLELEKRG